MRDGVVELQCGARAFALLQPWPEPRLDFWPAVDVRTAETLLAVAFRQPHSAEPARARMLLRALGSSGEVLPPLLDALRRGELVGLVLPVTTRPEVLAMTDHAVRFLPQMRRASLNREERAGMLLAGTCSRAMGGLLGTQAVRVLATWSAEGAGVFGEAVRAVQAVMRQPESARMPFIAAAYLRRTAERLMREDEGGRGPAMMDLQAAVKLLGADQTLGVLAQMTPVFRWNVPRAQTSIEEAPSRSSVRGIAPPTRTVLPQQELDEVAQATTLREAAKHGIPFCIPCTIAAAQQAITA